MNGSVLPAKTVSVLWDKLEAMEAECRFQGSAYPQGTVRFPYRLSGQGFFPGGDGLWRDDQNLRSTSAGLLPDCGVMFLANDFGSVKSFEKLRGFENPPTWRHLKARVVSAEIPQHLTFFTNAFLGLREEGRALEKRDWSNMPEFCRFCAEFLDFQLAQLRPRLVVLMGASAQNAFDRLVAGTPMKLSFGVLRTTHPYGDFGLDESRRSANTMALANAWSENL